MVKKQSLTGIVWSRSTCLENQMGRGEVSPRTVSASVFCAAEPCMCHGVHGLSVHLFCTVGHRRKVRSMSGSLLPRSPFHGCRDGPNDILSGQHLFDGASDVWCVEHERMANHELHMTCKRESTIWSKKQTRAVGGFGGGGSPSEVDHCGMSGVCKRETRMRAIQKK